jgi:hypothetical protein
MAMVDVQDHIRSRPAAIPTREPVPRQNLKPYPLRNCHVSAQYADSQLVSTSPRSLLPQGAHVHYIIAPHDNVVWRYASTGATRDAMYATIDASEALEATHPAREQVTSEALMAAGKDADRDAVRTPEACEQDRNGTTAEAQWPCIRTAYLLGSRRSPEQLTPTWPRQSRYDLAAFRVWQCLRLGQTSPAKRAMPNRARSHRRPG